VKHQSAVGGHLVDVGKSTIMVQEVSTITPSTIDGGNKGVIIATSTLQKVQFFAKHDVKAMVQQVASNLVSTACLLIAISEKACAQPKYWSFATLGLYARCNDYTLINVI
jgi:hypothetical protein